MKVSSGAAAPDNLYFSTKLPIHDSGWLEIRVDIKDIDASSADDQQFILTVLDKVTAFAMWCVPSAVTAKPVVPAEIRGRMRA